MKKIEIYIYLIILFLVLSVNSAIALRCGNDLIQEGDSASKVRIALTNNGGEIIEKGYTGARQDNVIASKKKGRNTSGKHSSHSIEKWFVRSPSGYGRPYCYELTFVGSKLKEIGSGVDCK